MMLNFKTEINVIDYIENRLDEKIDSKINQLKAELNSIGHNDLLKGVKSLTTNKTLHHFCIVGRIKE